MRPTHQAYTTRHMPRHDYLINARMMAPRGNELPQAALTPEAVREIRANRDNKTAKQLAADYNVHYRTIEKIRYFETWVHV